jgi:tetratricopeptide (TPR) repeat protein
MSDDDKHRARIFLHRGDLLQARNAWEAAVADDRECDDKRELSNSLGNLGNTCALLHEFDQAERCYREVLELQRTERDRHAIAHTLVNLGNLHIGADRPAKARPYFLEALDILRELRDDRALGILYHNLAMQEARDGRWEKALETFSQALDSHRIVGNEEGLALTSSYMGKGFLDRHDLIRAERCLNNAFEHYIKLGHEAAEAAVLRLLATLYELRQDPQSARRCLERVVQIDQHYHLPDTSADHERLTRLSRPPSY